VQLTALPAVAAPVGSMGTQTSQDDTLSKVVAEQGSQGSAAAVTSPLQTTPMEPQVTADGDGECSICNQYIFVKDL
jgi:hypothetical protein